MRCPSSLEVVGVWCPAGEVCRGFAACRSRSEPSEFIVNAASSPQLNLERAVDLCLAWVSLQAQVKKGGSF